MNSEINRLRHAALLKIIEEILPFAEFGWTASHPAIKKVEWPNGPPDLDAANKSLERAREALRRSRDRL